MFISPFSKWKKIGCPGRHAFVKDSVWPVHDIIDNSCVKGPQELSSPTSSSKQGQLWGQASLLRTSCSWVLKTSKSGASMTPLGSLLYCFAFLMGKGVLFVTSLNLSGLKLCRLSLIFPPCTTENSLDLSL